jgi:hypothetical protein
MKTHIWIGVIPGIFGYGISVASETKEGAMKALKKSWKSFLDATTRQGFGQPATFKEHFESFGGHVTEVELDRAYYDNFGE